MRRKDREITDRSEIDAILEKARVCRVAFARENEAYLVPLFFGYDGMYLYVHTAREGKKHDFLAANPKVCFEVEGEFSLIPHETEACQWSAYFESVIGYGQMVELLEFEDKVYGLNQVMRHYSGKAWSYTPQALQKARVWRIEITSMTGKRAAPVA